MDRISLDIDAVTELVDEIAKAAILPRFRRLSREGVEHKSTPADPDDIAASDQESGGSTLR